MGEKVHCGHKHKNPLDIRLEMKDVIPPADMQIASDSFDSHIRTSSTQRLLETRTGETLNWHQIHQLRRKQQKEQQENQKTACDQLDHYLITNDDISCAFLFADPKTHLITIKKKKKKKDKRNSALTVEEINTQLLQDETDSPSI